jgi:uncharacterized protein (TIGR04255 family)
VPQPARDLPDFHDPPVIETVVGVEFEALDGWDIRHFGLYWQAVRDDYPHFEVQPPLNPTEPPGPAHAVAQNLVLNILPGPPSIRAWYIDAPQSRLIQIQEDRFIHNWRKISGDEPYPHYDDSIRPTFEKEWVRYQEFLQEHGSKAPEVRRWEVTYVNHLERGREWEELSELGEIVSFWTQPNAPTFLPSPNSVTVQVHYPIGQQGDYLRVLVQPVIRGRDEREVLQVRITAAGRTRSSDLGEVLRCLDLGREWVVRGFGDITTAKMHHLWGKKERP